MPRVSIGTPDRARPGPPPAGVEGPVETCAYFDGERDPVHLHLHRLSEGTAMRLSPIGLDRLGYVWEGAVEAGGHRLERGSSFIVEQGAALEVVAQAEAALAVFAPGHAPEVLRDGGHVHLLPYDRVPRVPDRTGSGTTGALHSDGRCPTCELWLNENSLAGRPEAPSPEEALRGTHAHPADEIIFITEGQVRLGHRLYDRGTALAIAAHTLYGFSPGPEGVSFITFRPTRADTIRFAAGGDYAESTYFNGIGTIAYLEPVAG
ncbi:MAG TPA: hypothetical protein VF503_12840 [Sphingobium sp.]|uniref:hypothetical protein n=1 Tax=Sphingobium sp. TaxID=1912891 RepID=UPI002ED3F806